MMVTTVKQAAHLNSQGVTDPYRAANGHLMVAPLRYPADDGPCSNCGGTGATDHGQYVCGFCKGHGNGAPRLYQVGDMVQSTSYNAWCAPNCGACQEGDPLPDW